MVSIQQVPAGGRAPAASTRGAVGATLAVVSAVRLVGVVLIVPASLTSGRFEAPAALAVTTVVVAGHLAAWPVVGQRSWAAPVMLVLDLGGAALVLDLDGPGLVLANHLSGAALVAAALLGLAGAGVAAVVGAGFGVVLAGAPGGATIPAAVAASVPVPFVAVALLVAAVRHVLVEQERGRALLRGRARAEAAEQERSRLARELHDSAAKTVVGITLSATSLRQIITGDRPSERAERVVVDIVAAAESAAAELRGVIADLRAPCHRDPTPLAQGLDRLVTAWGEHEGVRTLVRVPADLALGADAQETALAVVGECLANARRHARAGVVEVQARPLGADVVVQVRDDGVGFAVPTSPQELLDGNHFGLVGMTERARLAGGDLRITSGAGGTTATLVLPGGGPRRTGPARARPGPLRVLLAAGGRGARRETGRG